ncbi:putative C6 transcription factor [Paecilomyces variotii]|uniref:Putative C6 transcription factor n=1 Tax=Byssochlamys spectabilis TaxID=264951 RepID=A0A443I1B0_BYSSP|nr:putative C6 transcription factor [Paecilomyces variotii]KAJ9219217.1 transcriptional regulator family: Fungal Specific TF [Paecilomyces variotii]KAJ9244381.1 transcriptional regulator family: Fungal Specific TF [Paecilomyces variotii]KAJ9247186.1 transcriptional regulator family: Fungal Specific TF [Paecilomyces variotii]KAJ9265964.1 transcriptional regulator family: Fungal Specific TF [Paecilomyces variotii]KAJ9291773.1 transcriptional regulator family: Fungal Specific TF [Paecilomyces var
MRSSIACSRCRRSKIKCVNAGIDTTCRACESSGRDCVYPTPAIGVGGGAAKRDIGATIDGDDRNGEWDSPKRQRSRKAVGGSSVGAKDAARANGDVLESSILTVKTWETLFELFQAHFSTVLPFLHPTTFLNQIRQLSASQGDAQSTRDLSQSPAPKPEPSPLILLGVLALTARFHPQLVAYHSPASAGNPSNPLAASEFYATALRNKIAGVDGLGLTIPDLTRIQALLMLALHEWGMCRGKSAWVYVGVAIRLGQAMGLSFELENDLTRDPNRSPVFKAEADHFGVAKREEQKEQNSDDVIALETKRRTFWACFIMDRCLSSGKYRPQMINVYDLDIQLPSDNAFAFGERVRTSRLNDGTSRRPPSFDAQNVQIPSLRQSIGYGDEKLRNGSMDSKSWSSGRQRSESGDHEIDRWEVGAEESVLSRVIRIIRIWGSIAKWACAGGRRNENYPPWHPESRFIQLRSMLAEFQDVLPRNIQYSPRNTDTHIMYKHTLAPYTVMHVVYFLSVIVLHRAYMPFLPIRCGEPLGPLDEPTLPVDKYHPPDGFWRESARELFKAARQMMDLVVTCQERGVLVETPLVGFAIYNAAFIGVYAAHFSHMDQEGYMCSKSAASDTVAVGSPGQLQARRGLEILREMRPRLKMAAGWFRTINRLHTYFSRVKKDFRRNSRKSDLMTGHETAEAHTNGVRPIREGGTGGGLDEFKLLEKLFLDFGILEDQLPENDQDGGLPLLPAAGERGVTASDAGSNAVKSEAGDGSESQLDGAGGRRESWIPINNNSPVHGMPDGERQFERRPSLPMPPGRQLPAQSPYSLPSLQHHPHGPIAATTSPSLPSLTSPNAYASPPTNQPQSQYLPPTNRLQPLNSWVTARQQPPPPPPYSQSLPPISAAAQHGYNMLPPPGTTTTASYAVTLPVAPYEGSDPSVWSTSFGGDDVIAFVDGCSHELWPSTSNLEVGSPTGWLSALWTDLR